MTLVVSTSSPVASVALFGADRRLLAKHAELAPGRASGAVVQTAQTLLEGLGATWADVKLFVADTGPGGFTGVRVGVTVVKTWGFALAAPVAGISAFELIASDGAVAVPVKKGEWLVRDSADGEPVRVTAFPTGAVGYGQGVEEEVFPDAGDAGPALANLRLLEPAQLLPTYLAEPSISVPNRPYGLEGAH